MQQLSYSMLAVCLDTRYLLEEAQKLAKFFKIPVLRRIDRRDGYFHLRRPH